ncbi:FAD-binding oxidoreductase [Sphingosinicella rhizophila]|uniref:FAD-binding oxidoreductase n=1 Tax=Sphingosinicella rhizophila TaxID=3050082 RepID=A0ABU3Q9C3_9SPHN|nr:FAD-binding oxidoreductase [Sphingosinicella sp. GR2756]MDT9599704.1 FAD-binding oxidoreductase [Sphingosinicella sp. GR2756]
MPNPPSETLLRQLAESLGPRGFSRAPEDLKPWLTDWRGRWHGRTAALLSPETPEQVQAIVTQCAAERVAIVPQGGNTSMVGGATPSAEGNSFLLSLRRMRRIREISASDNMLVAEAGLILADVHEAAEGIGRRFPLSLAAKGSATVGGLVSTNAGGTQVLRFGTMRALVLGLEAVLPDGSLYHGLSGLRKDNRGYDLRQMLIGAEGTLGIVTAASLRLVAAVGSRAVAWTGLASPDDALRLLRHLEGRLGDRVESFELIPSNALELVIAHIPGTRAPLAQAHAWHALVEVTAPAGEAGAEHSLAAALADSLDRNLAADATIAANEAQAQALWRLRESIAEAERKQGASLKHDIAVPVSAMPGFLVSARKAVEGLYPGCRIIAFGHLGDGNVHFNVQPPADACSESWLSRPGGDVSDLIYDLVTAAGGSISAEHGIGQMKADALARTADPALLFAQRAIKAALDPAGIMNPGKIFPG